MEKGSPHWRIERERDFVVSSFERRKRDIFKKSPISRREREIWKMENGSPLLRREWEMYILFSSFERRTRILKANSPNKRREREFLTGFLKEKNLFLQSFTNHIVTAKAL